jgi:hypothetical protein
MKNSGIYHIKTAVENTPRLQSLVFTIMVRPSAISTETRVFRSSYTMTYALLCALCTTKSDLAQMHPACSFINPAPYDNLRVHHSMRMNLQRFICADKI